MIATDVKGGPAFPSTFDDTHYFGASLRDYFAAKAMQGMMARIGAHEAHVIAHDAYILADAMISERDK